MLGSATSGKEQIVKEGEHLLGKFIGDAKGKTLIVFGGVHGNEASGVLAIKRVLPKLEPLKESFRGRIYLLAGNTRALNKGIRFIDSDLNRHFTVRNVNQNLPQLKNETKFSEDVEQKELLTILLEILRTAGDEVYVLDLHSTSADGKPFGTVGDTLRNRHFAQNFPITFLLGIEEQLEGTILEYLNNRGAITLGFEAGQHFAESTINNHEALIWLSLANAGVLRQEEVPDFTKHYQTLEKATGGERIVEIRYRHAITEKDDFVMRQGFENFQPVEKGQLLAKDKQGEIKAKETGMVLMPLYQKLGEDGFFLGREISPFWLWLSEILRKAKLPQIVHWLPGVKKHETEEGVYRIDTKIARFFPLQIFHLLGFRKRRLIGNELIVSRRLYDTKSPFLNK
jgi:succinylglutamate desuccinylase